VIYLTTLVLFQLRFEHGDWDTTEFDLLEAIAPFTRDLVAAANCDHGYTGIEHG